MSLSEQQLAQYYNEDYFERGIELGISGYSNYRWIPELTIPMCARIIEYLDIKEDETILDFGCAKGYIVKAFRLLRRNCFGYDISNYALNAAPVEIRPYISNKLNDYFEWVISKDVFEHIPYNMILSTLINIRSTCDKMFVVVPLGDGTIFNCPTYENDITHIIRESKHWWIRIFQDAGFQCMCSTYRVEGIKDNYAQYEKGNGFFILK